MECVGDCLGSIGDPLDRDGSGWKALGDRKRLASVAFRDTIEDGLSGNPTNMISQA